MTESEWTSSDTPAEMLEFLRQSGILSKRKWRLFAVACCRRIDHLLTDQRSRQAVDVAERYADGQASESELDLAFDRSFDVGAALAEQRDPDRARFDAAGLNPFRHAAWAANEASNPDEASDGAASEAAHAGDPATEQRAQAAILRCLFGNPFRTSSIDSSWLTPCVVSLADKMYTERRFDQMPELAAALRAAECNAHAFISHCLNGHPHSRGCWVVDSIQNRS